MANPTNAVKIALEFAKKWEKCYSASPTSLKSVSANAPDDTLVYAYWDKVAEVWTIGWGNTYYLDGSKVKSGDVITKGEADDLAFQIMLEKELAIRDNVDYQRLSDNEYAALISISYNAGEGNFVASRIDDAVNSGANASEVASIIEDSIVTSKGKFVQGLKNRRIDEAKLYLGEYNALYSYYLRNSQTINYAVVGAVIIGLTAYLYFIRKKKILK